MHSENDLIISVCRPSVIQTRTVGLRDHRARVGKDDVECTQSMVYHGIHTKPKEVTACSHLPAQPNGQTQWTRRPNGITSSTRLGLC